VHQGIYYNIAKQILNQHTMKKINFLMLFALVFLLFGCREELDVISHPSNSSKNIYNLNKDNVKTQILKKTDYENKKFLKPHISRVSSFLKTQYNTNPSLSKSTELVNGYEIYTNTFEEVSYLDAKYYSFYIIGENQEYEEKLVLKSINNQVIEKYILKYKLLPNFSIDPASYQVFKVTETTGSANGESLIMFIDTFSMGCSSYTVTTYNCGHQGNHSNGQYCSVLQMDIPYDTVVVNFDASCTSSGSSSGSPTGNNPTGGGSVPDNNPTPPVITIPTTAPLYIVRYPHGKECNPLGLDADEVEQINNNYNLRLRIYQYFATKSTYPFTCDNFISEENETFVKAILKYFNDHPTEDFSSISSMLDSVLQFFNEEYADIDNPLEIFHRIKALDNALVQNPNLLLDINCAQLGQLDDWSDIANHPVPQSVKNKIQNIKNQTNFYDNWLITDLDDGVGARLNMDFFPIKITSMPEKSPGIKYTHAEFFDYFRKNINLFAEKFTPIKDIYYGIDDTALWFSNNPLGALIHIEIPLDDGTVVCSGFSSNAWIFSTVKAPLDWYHDGIHPVAGNRAFSYYTNPNDGSITIYTRGVDRVSHNYSNTATVINHLIESAAFKGADQLWEAMQTKLSNFVISHGGQATKVAPIKYRPKYTKIKDYIKGEIPISSLNCN
jgi:hypothetical protein